MPTHKMITIDGVRVRAEDAARYQARASAPAGPLTRAHVEPPKAPEQPAASGAPAAGPEPEPEAAAPFDPSQHDVPAVLKHLAGAGEDETARVLAAEAAGKNRKTILGKDTTT